MKINIFVVMLISLFTLTLSPLFGQEGQHELDAELFQAAEGGDAAKVTRYSIQLPKTDWLLMFS